MNRAEIILLVSALKNAGYTANIIPDLCNTAISDTEEMTAIASTTVVACYPRAVRSIFDSVGLKPERVFDIRNNSSEQILSEMGVFNGITNAAPTKAELQIPLNLEPPSENEQEAWFPVIDRERCTNCSKCHDFCLFGVYSVRKGTVKVKQPQNCKNNCPACARVCPSKAIIFPKYEKSPINGGLHDEEHLDDIDFKSLHHIALKYKLEERRAKVSLLKKNQP